MPKTVPRRVALLGLAADERLQVARCVFFAGTADSPPTGYVPAERLDDAELLIADAADGPSVQLVLATERLTATLFIGSTPPPGALACLSRPLEAAPLLRELGFLAAAPRALAAARLQQVAASPWKGASRQRHSGWPPLQATALIVSSDTQPGPDATTAPGGAAALAPMLRAAGVTVDVVGTGQQALARLSQHHFDLIFVDAGLAPERVEGAAHGSAGTASAGRDSTRLDALALCQRIKRAPLAAHTLGARLVLLSLSGSQLDRVRATLAGCDDCLALPAEPAALQALLLPLR